MYDYTVRAAFADPTVAEAWVAWLQDGHVAKVLAVGALSAAIVQLDGHGHGHGDDDGDDARYEVRYTFASKAAFEAYEREHAPRLRAAGASRFPPEVAEYSRSKGAIIWSSPR